LKTGIKIAAPLAALILTACDGGPVEQEKSEAEKPALMAAYQGEVVTLVEQPAVKGALDHIVGQNAQNIRDLIELTEIPAPPFGEEKRGARFAEMLRAAGLRDVTIDDVGNVIGRRPGTRGERTVALGAHLDTVFPIETDVTVRVEGDTYYAPGIGDNTQGLVLLLSLLRTLEAADLKTEADVLFVGTVGEEGLGDLRGVKHLFRDGGPKINSFIAVDGGDAARLIYSAVGSHRYRVTVNGPGGHSWGAFGLANPHHALGRIMTEFADSAPAVTSQGPKTSFSVGRIGGGTSINSIPFSSWFEVDMRSGSRAKLDEIDAVFQKAVLDGLAAENAARIEGPELTVEVKKVGDRPAGAGDPNGALVQRAMAAMQRVGVTARLSASSTDASIPISLGMPAITISRGGKSEKAHSPAESWTNVDSHLAIQIALLVTLAEAGLERAEQ